MALIPWEEKEIIFLLLNELKIRYNLTYLYICRAKKKEKNKLL